MVLGGIASVAQLWQIGSERRQIAADAQRAGVDNTERVATMAVSLLEPSQDQIAFLRRELSAARDENTVLRSEIARLHTKIAR
jgi:phage shock protein A